MNKKKSLLILFFLISQLLLAYEMKFNFNKEPLNWTKSSKTHSLWEKSEGRNNSGTIKLINVGKKSHIWASKLIPFQGKCRVSCWIKTDNIQTGDKPWNMAFFSISAFDINGQRINKKNLDIGRVDGTKNWHLISREFTLPPTTQSIKLQCGISGNAVGTTWFDDISVLSLSGFKPPKTESKKKKSAMDIVAEEEMKRLQPNVGKKPANAEKEKKATVTNIKITQSFSDDSILDSRIKDEKFPIPEIKIKGKLFLVNGKPAYLIGIEDLFPNPWTSNLLGMDFSGFYIWSFGEKIKNGNLILNSATPGWAATVFRERLAHGIMPYYQVMLASRIKKVRKYFPQLCLPYGNHYLTLDPITKIGQEVRKSFYETAFKHVKGLPSLGIEVYNEVVYQSPISQNVDSFRKAMGKKYGKISNANAAWTTLFADFKNIEVPFKAIHEIYHIPPGMSKEFLFEWFKFNEKCFGDAALKTDKNIRSVAGNSIRTTIQATSGLAGIYSGNGVNPREKVKSESFYGAEFSDNFFMENMNDSKYRHMFKQLIVRDYLRNVSPVPIINEECSSVTIGATKDELIESSLVKFKENWIFKVEKKYKPAKKETGLLRSIVPSLNKDIPNWENLKLDDSDWKKVKNSEHWGEDGYPLCTVGWYRCHFKLSEQDLKNKLYFHGSSFADRAKIFLNGKLIKDTSLLNWNSKWSVPVTKLLNKPGEDNVLVIRLENNYFNLNTFVGGLRGYASLSTIENSDRPAFTGSLIRSTFWSDAVHGIAGRVTTYQYAPPEGAVSSLYSFNNSRDSLIAIPTAKNEVNSVSDIVLPRLGKKKTAAMLYSLPTFRAMLGKGYLDKVYGKPIRDIAGTYGAILKSGISLDIIDDVNMNSENIKEYKLIFCPLAKRIEDGVLENMKNYVKNGGILVLEYGSFVYNDDWHKAIPTPNWWGIEITGERETIATMTFSGEKISSQLRETDEISGEFIKTTTATVLALYHDGSPAITSNTFCKGKVIYIAGTFSIADTAKIVEFIAEKNNIKPQLNISGNNYKQLLETQVFSTENSHLWYFMNWGEKSVSITAKTYSDFKKGEYIVREIQKGTPIGKLRSAESLKNSGITLVIPPKDPVVIFIESNKIKPRNFVTFTPMQKKWLPKSYNISPKADKKILFLYRPYIRRQVIQTAVHLLESQGFEVRSAKSAPSLDGSVKTYSGFPADFRNDNINNYDVLFLPGPFFGGGKAAKNDKKESDAIEKYINNGGSLFVCSFVHRNIRPQNRHRANAILKPYGLKFDWNTGIGVHVNKDFHFNEKRFITFKIQSDHPIFNGVKTFQSFGIGPIKLPKDSKAEILLTAPDSAGKSAGKPLMVYVKHGKGNVLYLGDSFWLKGYSLPQGDNARLLVNIFTWLATGKAADKDNEKLKEIISNP
jgi:glycosyl hydrolase family 42 (putative beta-galactosidase)